jgi:hypothetical protein
VVALRRWAWVAFAAVVLGIVTLRLASTQGGEDTREAAKALAAMGMTILVSFVAPGIAAWVLARFTATRIGALKAAVIAVAVTTLLWAAGEAYLYARAAAVDGLDPIVGITAVVFPPLTALAAAIGALIAVRRRPGVTPGRVAWTLLITFVVTSAVGVAVAASVWNSVFF